MSSKNNQKSSQSKSAGPQPKSDPKKEVESSDNEEEKIKKVKDQVAIYTEKIMDHYKVIQNLREEDRRKWKEFSMRLETLEELKSQRGKKKRYRKKKLGESKSDLDVDERNKKVEQAKSDAGVEERKKDQTNSDVVDVVMEEKGDVQPTQMTENKSKEKSTQVESKKHSKI